MSQTHELIQAGGDPLAGIDLAALPTAVRDSYLDDPEGGRWMETESQKQLERDRAVFDRLPETEKNEIRRRREMHLAALAIAY